MGIKELKLKCPYCGNPLNEKKLIKVNLRTRTAYFVCSCWSGDLDTKMPRHHFIVKIKNMRVFEVDNNELDEEYDEVEL